MPLPRTALHADRVADQATRILGNVYDDLKRNTARHLAFAQAFPAGLTVARLRQYVLACADNYEAHLDQIEQYGAFDAGRRALLGAGMMRHGYSIQDAEDAITQTRAVLTWLRSQPLSTAAEIAAACASLLTNIEPGGAMPITAAKPRRSRLMIIVRERLHRLQSEMARSPIALRAAAQSVGTPAAQIAAGCDELAQYGRSEVSKLNAAWNDPVKGPELRAAVTQAGWTEQDLMDVAQPIFTACTTLLNATKNTKPQIIAALDAFTAAVDDPETLWPE